MSVENPLPTHRRAKRLLLGALVLLLLLPMLRLPEPALGGAFTRAPLPELSLGGLRDNTYQPALEKHLEDRLGFRNFLIRLHNQLLYSLLGITHHPEILIGKNNVLFMAPYIRAYLGEDRLDTATVRHRVLRLRVLQQDLAKRGISFLFVLAPSKARFEPENLPDHPAPLATTNYDLFVRQMQTNGINLLDCVALFARWKPTSPYPLYPRGGTHWSGYGATRVADSLLHRLEVLGGYQLPSFREVGRPTIVYDSDLLRSTDNDLNVAFNLLLRQETTPLAYRHIQFDPPRPGQVQPSLLLVSDSYCWGLMQFSPYLQRAFAPDSRVWFYNKEVYAPDTVATKLGEVKDLNLQQEVEKRRTIVLMMTDFNLPEHEFWFTDNLYGLYHPFTDADYYAVNQLAAKIKAAGGPGIQAGKPEQLDQRAHDQALQQYDTQRLQRILATSN